MSGKASKKQILNKLDIAIIAVVSILGLGVLGFAAIMLWTHAII